MTTAISVKNIGKQYKIGAAETKFRYNMLRDGLGSSPPCKGDDRQV